jgi:hypothetical protein
MTQRTLQFPYPFDVDPAGQVVSPGDDLHVRELIEQVLFTAPGERVNRPSFGCGLNRIVFEPGTSEMLAANQSLIRAQLQDGLGDVIAVSDLRVSQRRSVLEIDIAYVVLATRRTGVATFRR